MEALEKNRFAMAGMIIILFFLYLRLLRRFLLPTLIMNKTWPTGCCLLLASIGWGPMIWGEIYLPE